MIQKIRMVDNVAVVTAMDEFDPLRELVSLANELENIGFRGEVLFDLLATNGLADNRFVTVLFDGKDFDRKSMAVETDVDDSIRLEQDALAKSDPIFLRYTVLSSTEIDLFLH